MKPAGFRLFVMACVAGLASTAWAVSIPVTNSSFEDPFVTGNGGFYQTGTPNGWTSSGFAAQYIERSDNGGFTGQPGITGANGQYIADDGTGTLTQDLGVPFLPFTTYTVNMAGGHRSGFDGNITNFGLQSTASPGVDLAGATIGFINEGALTVPRFDYASAVGGNGGVFTFTTGALVPAGNLLAFIRNTSAGRMHADSFSVTAVPEPTSLVLLGLGAIGLFLVGRRRRGA